MPSQEQKQIRGVFERVKGSDDWYIRWADRDGRLRKEHAGTRAAAKKLYSVRRGEALKGIEHKFKQKRTTFGDLAAAALEYSKAHKKSYQDDVERMEVLVKWFGHRRADQIRPQDIDRKLNEALFTRNGTKTQRPWSAATMNKYKALVSLAYRLGMENGKVAVNPARLVKHRHEDNGIIRFLTPDEETKLKAAIEPKHPARWAVIQLALSTGCRAGELWRLKWTEVDRTSPSPLVTLLETKNGTHRTVPVNADALAALEMLKTHDEGKGFVLPRQHYRMWFAIALKKANITDFTFHCFRHTFGSRLVSAGVDLVSVARLMGHKTIQLTMRYSHPAPDHLMDAVNKLALKTVSPSVSSVSQAA